MAISAQLVMQLRERTGAGMMECKKYLITAEGDIDKAADLMRKDGQAKADKKAGRIAAEGIVVIGKSDDNKNAVILEINSETDFVARDDNFVSFANACANTALNNNVDSVEKLAECKTDDGNTIEETRQQLVAKIGENIKVRRLKALSSEAFIGSYLHSNKIGVLVSLNVEDEMLAKDIAMHIAASKPLVVSSSEVPQDVIEKEKEIFLAQAESSGKPAEVIAKMVEGRINKFIDEVSLSGQPFVKDTSKKISQLLKEKNAEVLTFVRYEVGEGIEKKEDNFVAEVMAQVK